MSGHEKDNKQEKSVGWGFGDSISKTLSFAQVVMGSSISSSSKTTNEKTTENKGMLSRAFGHVISKVSKALSNGEPSFYVTFHVYLPPFDEKKYSPIILGSIPELGLWNSAKGVGLVLFKDNYWVSHTVEISGLSTNIEYKYVLCSVTDPSVRHFEGENEKQNRRLGVVTDAFDIWISNHIFPMKNSSKDFSFIIGIMQSLSATTDNFGKPISPNVAFKEAVMKYELLRKQDAELARTLLSPKNLAEIIHIAESSMNQLFVFVILSYSFDTSSYNSLSEDFPSGPLLLSLPHYNKDLLPSNAVKNSKLEKAINTLVQHNSTSGLCDWMIMFGLTEIFDSSWFGAVKPPHSLKNSFEAFEYSFQNYVVPNFVTLEPAMQLTALKCLIKVAPSQEILLILYNNDLFKDAFTKSDIEKPFFNRVSTILQSESAASLQRAYGQLPKHIVSKFSSTYRKSVLMIFDDKKRISNESDIAAIFSPSDTNVSDSKEDQLDLLRSLFPLPESGDEFQKMFERFATSPCKDLIPELVSQLLFPAVKDYPIPMKKHLQTLNKVCTAWHKALPEKHDISYYLKRISLIVPDKQLDAWPIENLLELAKKRIDANNNVQVLRAAPQVGTLRSTPVMEMYCNLAKLRLSNILDRRVGNADHTSNYEAIPEYLNWLCENGSALNIPNKMCEKLLLHVIKYKLKNLPKNHTALEQVNDISFWALVLEATGEVTNINKSLTDTRTHIKNLAADIDSMKITIKNAAIVVKHPKKYLERFFQANDVDTIATSPNITQKKLEEIEEILKGYQSRFKLLRTHIETFGSSSKVINYQGFLADLKHLESNVLDTTVADVSSNEFWAQYLNILDVAKDVQDLRGSRVLQNLVDDAVNESTDNLDVERVTVQIVKAALDTFHKRSQRYGDWCRLDCTSEKSLWRNIVDVNAIRHELEYMRKCGGKLPSESSEDCKRLVKALQSLTIIDKRTEQLRDILLLRPINTDSHDESAESSDNLISQIDGHLNNLEDTVIGCSLKDIYDFDVFFDKYLTDVINDNSCKMLKALRHASELLNFIETIKDEDLKNWINAVDDITDDSSAQEAPLVTSLEEVKRELLPVIPLHNLNTRRLLEELKAIVDKNSHVASKILFCNQSLASLKRIHLNISNRGEATKERIKNAVKGKYTFEHITGKDICNVTMRYTDKGGATVSCSLADLVDLRGRGLLLVDPANKFGREFLSEHPIEEEDVMHHIKEFVHQVEMVGDIMDLAAQLFNLGHFAYQEFSHSVTSSEGMKGLHAMFSKDLSEWKSALEISRSQCYFIMYFKGCHLKFFRDLAFELSDINSKEKTMQTCAALFHYYNKNVSPTIPDMTRTEGMPEISTLEFLGNFLQEILSPLPPIHEPIPMNFGRRVMSDIVTARKLFVAVCRDQNLVPNVVMSLYANRGHAPQPSQVLLCQPTTTEEEIDLILKRCFWKNHRREKQLFCIASVERLTFEAKSFLVRRIIQLQTHQKALPYLLSLICVCETDKHLDVLDDFADFVHYTDGLGEAAMKNIIRHVTNNYVEVLSSDISGQGKTYYIEKSAAVAGRNRRILLISDTIDRAEVVRQLHTPTLKPEKEYLHLIISNIANPSELNLFLFEILVLRVVFGGSEVAFLPSDLRIYIELESLTVDNIRTKQRGGNRGLAILEFLPFISHFNRQHLTFDINALDVPTDDLFNSIQIVARYLSALYEKTIDFQDVNLEDIPIAPTICHRLLQEYYVTNNKVSSPSIRLLNTFIRVLADQLRYLSQSPYLCVSGLDWTGIDAPNTRTILLNALIDVSRDFALRSMPIENTATEQADYVEYMNTMRKWTDSNHLLVFFQSQNEGSICMLYRNPDKVAAEVKQLLMSQSIPLVGGVVNQFQFTNMQAQNFIIPDYSKMHMSELLMNMEMIARTSSEPRSYPPYALSADNLLKMALILLRTRANIPVVLCGEAGCGKTSQVAFLANMVQVQFLVFDIHAGITKENIKEFIMDAEEKATQGEVWVFLDEINTCDHLGMLANLICDRIFKGNEIHKNIRLLAACNPYRRRREFANDAGLQQLKNVEVHEVQQRKSSYMEQSELVYQVHPLPQKLLDFIWDYGVLEESDESAYIKIMAKSLNLINGNNPECKLSIGLFADLLIHSQKFIRNIEDSYSVSLRDVRRTINFARFFDCELNSLARQNRASTNKMASYPPYPPPDELRNIRPIILALALCYQGRLADQSSRQKYRDAMCGILVRHHITLSSKDFINIVRDDQLDIIFRMNLPPFTACNEALLENVHCMTACILTRTPLFVIGAPGASKSLAIMIVKDSLRGRDSVDPYFQTHPQIYIIPHQGSSSSTSEGILKVFAKAERYETQHDRDKFPSRAVVLLDEVGLAETSPHNPLKVLHALLEPRLSEDGNPPVAVIGISNWRLDASKMSRAVRVLKPVQDVEDLETTTSGIVTSLDLKKDALNVLAKEYTAYRNEQPVANFHGLRDYYALVKCLGSHEKLTSVIMKSALARNFGGGKTSTESIYKRFFPWDGDQTGLPNALDCIKANLKDPNARHLMIIGETDFTIDVLENCLSVVSNDTIGLGKRPRVIYGSQFLDDQGPAYAYRILNTILLCVEEGRPVILKDLQIIYGSLYDLWNQNYTTVGAGEHMKKFCRVALGEYANSMCPVHPDFRCIVVMDHETVRKADPPLLNRFEKQHISWNSLINKDNQDTVDELYLWAREISTLQPQNASGQSYDETEMFVGFCGIDTIRCLVLRHSEWGKIADREEILKQSKQNLIQIACSESIVRASKSCLAAKKPEEVSFWRRFYFENDKHNDLRSFVEGYLLADHVATSSISGNTIIKTFSSINTNIQHCLDELGGSMAYQIEKLEFFKAERQLQSRIRHFWLESKDNLLIIQCDPVTTEEGTMKLARFLIDHHQKEYLSHYPLEKRVIKRACIIVHIRRGAQGGGRRLFHFDFLCDWYQIVIESLMPQLSLQSLLDSSISRIVENIYPLKEVLARELQWSILCIRYTARGSLDHIQDLITEIPTHHCLLNLLQNWVESWLMTNDTYDWQFRVACNRQLLGLSNSFLAALEKHVRHTVRNPLAKMIYTLEKSCALRSLLRLNPLKQDSVMQLWQEVCIERNIIRPDDEEDPKPNGYTLTGRLLNLKFPFSRYLWSAIEGYRPLYEQERGRWNAGDSDLHEEFTLRMMSSVPFIQHPVFAEFSELYVDDFMEMVLPVGTSSKHCGILREFVLRELDENSVNPIKLHLLWWNHEETFISQLRIIQFSLTLFSLELDIDIAQEDLVDIVTHHVLSELHLLNTDVQSTYDEDTNKEWLRSANLILALCSRVPKFTMRPSWRLLSLVSDIFATLFLPTGLALQPFLKILGSSEFSEIRNARLRAFIADILAYLTSDAVPESPEKESCRRLLILKVLDITLDGSEIIPLESLAELQILDNVFTREPLPLSAPLVYRIFEAENNANPGLFCRLLEFETNGDNCLFDDILSEGMLVINRCLDEAGPQSLITIICCDIIYERFLTLETAERLAPLLRDAIEILVGEGNRGSLLQYISAIALFKALLHKLASQCRLTPQEVNVDDFDFLIIFLNDDGEPQLKHRAIIFFLQSLRDMLGMTTIELKRYFDPFRSVFPWATEIDWRLNYSQREFDPYCFNDKALHAMEAFSRISNDSSRAEALLPLQDFYSILGFLGAAVNYLYLGIQWNDSQMTLVKWLRKADIPPQVLTVLDKLILCRDSPLFPSNLDDTKALLRHSVLARVISIHASMRPECSPLARYLHRPDEVQNNFVLTCPLDERTAVLSAVRAAGGSSVYTTEYQCSCGSTYVIADCGKPIEQSTCPTCKGIIGSIDYCLTNSNTIVNQPLPANEVIGYTQETVESLCELSKTVRTLNTTAFRILHLFVHTIFAFQPSAIVRSVTEKDPVIYCLEHIENDWDILRQILLCDDETVHLVFHAILTNVERYYETNISPLSTAKMIEDWEIEFMNACVTPVLSDMHQVLAVYMRDIGKMDLNRHVLENELRETMDISTRDPKQVSLARLWRYTGHIASAEDAAKEMHAYVGRDPRRQRMFPVLQLYIVHKDNLSLLAHLMPLVRFSNELSAMFLHRIKRDEARRYTFTSIFNRLKKQDFHKYEILFRLFNEFKDAWNAIRLSVTHYKCKELAHEMPIMNEDCPIIFALYDPTNESVYLCATFELLAGLQNAFLQDVSRIEREGCSSLLFLQTIDIVTTASDEENNQPERGHVWPVVKFNDLQEIQIISAANAILGSHLLTFYQWGLDYGGGQGVEFDLTELEWRLTRLLVLGKVHIQPEMEDFTYAGEMFKKNMRIIDEISILVPQAPLEATVAAQIRGNEYIRERASDLLTDLQMVLCYVQRTKGGDNKMFLAEYCRKWLGIQNMEESYSSLLIMKEAFFSRASLGEIRLSHIVALYESIEDIVSDLLFGLAPIDYLPSKYILPLDARIRHKFDHSCRTKGLVDAVAIALKRFIFRHLRDADCTIPSDLPINGSGYEELVSNDNSVINVFPGDLLIGHALEAYMVLAGGRQTHSNAWLGADDYQYKGDPDMGEEERYQVEMAVLLSLQDDEDNNFYSNESPSTNKEQDKSNDKNNEMNDSSDEEDDVFFDAESVTE